MQLQYEDSKPQHLSLPNQRYLSEPGETKKPLFSFFDLCADVADQIA